MFGYSFDPHCLVFSSDNRNEYELGSGDHLIVSWDIQSEVGANDWIGLFHSGKLYFFGVSLTQKDYKNTVEK